MIFGEVTDNKSTKYLPSTAQRLLEHLKTLDLANLEDGKYSVPNLDIDSCYYLVSRYNTSSPQAKQPEMHKKYADLQIIIRGQEMINCAFYNKDLAVSKEYDEEKDIMFFDYPNNEPQSSIIMDEGCFLFLNPNKDLHTPGLSVNGNVSGVIKLVGKIRV